MGCCPPAENVGICVSCAALGVLISEASVRWAWTRDGMGHSGCFTIVLISQEREAGETENTPTVRCILGLVIFSRIVHAPPPLPIILHTPCPTLPASPLHRHPGDGHGHTLTHSDTPTLDRLQMNYCESLDASGPTGQKGWGAVNNSWPIQK